MGRKIDEVIPGKEYDENGGSDDLKVFFHSATDWLILKQDGNTISLSVDQAERLAELIATID